ncbi:hypothetical protein [Paenibacillus donghaensis]|uniref:Uncharacterized protein n=1 Tax=Paenibacillus donghaensis TaxID=414771 RepID=A0A2Z2KSA3_9BACL|nr:hypothetical protein [Paenibacillus donghaensis]ASA25779.1 hypothetical protein B9T62_36660 [Paenibacillus donghaensis]
MKNLKIVEEMGAIPADNSAGKWHDRILTQSKLDFLRAYMEAHRNHSKMEVMTELEMLFKLYFDIRLQSLYVWQM